MPRSEKTDAALSVVDEAASRPLSLVLIEELAEPLAEYILADYDAEDWQNSPVVEALAGVAALLEVSGREVPAPIMAVLRRAAEAGRPIGVG